MIIEGNPEHELALCMPHDQSWSTVGGGEERHVYNDILFHNGKLYVSCQLEEWEEQPLEVLDHRDKIIRKGVYTVPLTGGCELEVEMVRFVYENVAAHGEGVDDMPIGFSIHERGQIVEHLVESCITGELLVVSAIQDLCSHINSAEDLAGPIEKFMCTQTRCFEVRRVVRGTDSLEKVTSGNIREQSIFIGTNGSFSLPTAYINEVESNCIYFAIDDAAGSIERIIEEEEEENINLVEHNMIEEEEEDENINLVELNMIDDDDDNNDDDEEDENINFIDDVGDISSDGMYIVREQGVFNLQENMIRVTSMTNLCVDSGSITGWFTPKLF